MSTETTVRRYLQDESLSILKVNNLKLLQDAPQKVEDLIKNNEFLNPSINFDEAEKRRKNLKNGRLDVQRITKDLTSSLNDAKKTVSEFEKELLADLEPAEEKQTAANHVYKEEQDWKNTCDKNTKEAYTKYIIDYSTRNSIPMFKAQAEAKINEFVAAEKAIENKYNDWLDQTTKTIYAINTSKEASELIETLENLDVDAFGKFADAAQEKRDSFLSVIDTKLANLVSAEHLARINEKKSAYSTDISRATLQTIGSIIQSIQNCLNAKPDFGEHTGLAIQEMSKLFTLAKERETFLISQKEMAEAKAEMKRQQAEMKAMQEQLAAQKAELERAENERKAAEAKAEAEKQAEINRLAAEKAAEEKAKERFAIDKEAAEIHAKCSVVIKEYKNATSVSDIEKVRELIAELENITPVYDANKQSLFAGINKLINGCNEKALHFQIAEEQAELEAQGKIKIGGVVYKKSLLAEVKAYFNSESFQNLEKTHSYEAIDELINEMREGKAMGRETWKDLTTVQKLNEAYRTEILNKVNEFATELFADGKLRNAFADGILNAHDLAKQFNNQLVFNSTK